MLRPTPLSTASPDPASLDQPNQALQMGPRTTEAAAIADYIFDMSDQLASLAERHGLDMLAYLLSMARLEAKLIAGRVVPPTIATTE